MSSLPTLKFNFSNIRMLSEVVKGNTGPVFQFRGWRTPTLKPCSRLKEYYQERCLRITMAGMERRRVENDMVEMEENKTNPHIIIKQGRTCHIT